MTQLEELFEHWNNTINDTPEIILAWKKVEMELEKSRMTKSARFPKTFFITKSFHLVEEYLSCDYKCKVKKW